MGVMSATKFWQQQRRLVHLGFSSESVKKYITAQEDVASLLSKALIDDPTHFVEHIRLYVN
jgi:cytochrome P450